jgi:hypothetical protein
MRDKVYKYNILYIIGGLQEKLRLEWGSRGRRFKSSRPDQIKTKGYVDKRNPIFLAFLALGTHLGTHQI